VKSDPFFNFASVIRDHLRGQLFAVRGDVDKYFQPHELKWANEQILTIRERRARRIQDRVAQHIRRGPEREQAALRLALLDTPQRGQHHG
jgi:hypothetical protein